MNMNMQMSQVHLYHAQTAPDSAAHLKHLLPPGFYIQSFQLTSPFMSNNSSTSHGN